tara:strand:+ start:172 stop:528 length:357 start_codon:yes stop_codon:yes gene_type:complete
MLFFKKVILFFFTTFFLIAATLFVYSQYFKVEFTQTKAQKAPETDSITATSTINIEPSVIPDDQFEVLKKAGVDPENISITSEMITCAEEAVGRERLSEIAEGNKPSLIEIRKLMSCL